MSKEGILVARNHTDMLPLFKTSYSLLKSILTLEPRQEDRDPLKLDSIVDIAVENSLKEVCIVDDSISSLLPAILAFQKEKIKLIYGFQVTFVVDPTEKNEESFQSAHKNIIFFKNESGYKKLIKLATKAGSEYLYKEPRLGYDDIKKVWDDNDLSLAVPFYDSFLHKNLLQNSVCIPDFGSIKPTFFLEDNSLPFDYLISEAVYNYANKNDYNTMKAKSIFYKNREDFNAYLTVKCLNRKQFGSGKTLDNPGLDHMSSREFCWESFQEKNK